MVGGGSGVDEHLAAEAGESEDGRFGVASADDSELLAGVGVMPLGAGAVEGVHAFDGEIHPRCGKLLFHTIETWECAAIDMMGTAAAVKVGPSGGVQLVQRELEAHCPALCGNGGRGIKPGDAPGVGNEQWGRRTVRGRGAER